MSPGSKALHYSRLTVAGRILVAETTQSLLKKQNVGHASCARTLTVSDTSIDTKHYVSYPGLALGRGAELIVEDCMHCAIASLLILYITG